MSLVTSTLVQGLVILLVIVAPLLVAQTMPEPVRQLALPPVVRANVDPPVASEAEPPLDTTTASEVYTLPSAVDAFVRPPAIPEGIPESDAYFVDRNSEGVPGGLPASIGGQPLSPREPPEPEDEVDPEPIRISGDVRPPKKIVHVSPTYPPLALASRIQGTVKLRAIIDVDGSVANLRVVDSVPLLDRAAVEAVLQWRYEPTLLNGRAVPVIMTVEVEFRLR